MSAAREHLLNTALADLDVATGYDEWLVTVDRFYAEHVEVSSDATPGRLIGRARVKEALLKILAPFQAFVDPDIESVSLRCLPIYADRHDEHHSAWSLEIVGGSGRRATVRWCVRRIWRGGLVVHEHFYENDMNGRSMAVDDLWIPTSAAPDA
jgi:hypothetical protein